MIVRILNRRDNTANWVTVNPILGDGEIGLERLTDGSLKMKIGNGTTDWNNLEYFNQKLITEIENHINNNTTAHEIDVISNDLSVVSSSLSSHISNNTDAHGIDTIKSDLLDINVEIDDLKNSIENIDIISIKGAVGAYADLPDPSALADGVAYIVEEDENNNGITAIYAVINEAWEFIAKFNIDLSDYYNKTEVDDELNNKLDKQNGLNSVYATDNTGEQTMLPASYFGAPLSYSLTEQDTGKKWIDGKNIYQKTYEVIIPPMEVTETIKQIIDLDVRPDIDLLIESKLFIRDSIYTSTGTIITTNNIYSANYAVFYNVNDYRLTFNVISENQIVQNRVSYGMQYVTILYTKKV
jgi:hypothetical protein